MFYNICYYIRHNLHFLAENVNLRIILSLGLFLCCVPLFALNPQTTDTILMVAPDFFQYNHETGASNQFAQPLAIHEVSKLAKNQFASAVQQLRAAGVVVYVLRNPNATSPDAVFPNNWFTSHPTEDGKTLLVLYPMFTPNRRAERQIKPLLNAYKMANKVVTRIIDLTPYESANLALEGTGSMVLDRINRVAYAALSTRTDSKVLADFAKHMHYEIITFASIAEQQPVYHTNVMLSIGTHFVVISADNILNSTERNYILQRLKATGRIIINITPTQMQAMAANIIELKNKKGEAVIAMSQNAYNAFTKEQLDLLKTFGRLVIFDIHVIEKIGGGSARCMIAEMF